MLLNRLKSSKITDQSVPSSLAFVCPCLCQVIFCSTHVQDEKYKQHDICDLYEVRDQKRHKYHSRRCLIQGYNPLTNNCILDLQRKISIRNAWRHYHSAVSFIYSMRSRAICKETSEEHVKQENDGVRFCNVEKDLGKVNLPFLMHSELSGL